MGFNKTDASEHNLIDLSHDLIDLDEDLIDLREPTCQLATGTDTNESPNTNILDSQTSISTWQNPSNILRTLDGSKAFAPPDPCDPANNPSTAPLGTWDILRTIDSLKIFGPQDTFQFFSFLPRELRVRIWKWALVGEVTERLVLFEITSRRILRPDNLVSPLLSVNNESRYEARAFYETRVEVRQMPSVVINTSYQPGRLEVDRPTLDEEAAKMGEGDCTGDKAVGVCYISVVRDTFAPMKAKYVDEPFVWKIPRIGRLSVPLTLLEYSQVRRVAEAAMAGPAPDTPSTEIVPAVELVQTVRRLQFGAQFDLLGEVFPALQHHGVFYIERLPSGSKRVREFLVNVRDRGRRGTCVFRKFLRPVDIEGFTIWRQEVDESLLGLVPHPEQTFALTRKELEQLFGRD